MAEIQRKVIKRSGRNPASRLLHAKNDKETIATWKQDLNRILQVFNVSFIVHVWPYLTAHSQTELAMNTHVIVSDIYRNTLKCQEGIDDQRRLVSNVCTLFYYRMNKQSTLRRLKPGQ